MKKITYLPDPGLEAAVEVALELGMPLLVTGEPGTGKTQLAYWAADKKEFNLHPQVLRFNTKTTSVAKDLFYRYDAIRHFRDASRAEVNVLNYITFDALGKAILAAASARRFVVLVDEIDKAPRDFPNDVLFEFEDMAFRIEEAETKDFTVADNFWREKPELAELKIDIEKVHPQQGVIRLPKGAPRPLLILTSNSEKNLPDAFLRRCVFYHIPFPDDKRLEKIVSQNVEFGENYEKMLSKIIEKFSDIRRKGLRKPPATAELVRWVEILEKRGIDLEKAAQGDEAMRQKLLDTYPVLAKNREDLEKLK